MRKLTDYGIVVMHHFAANNGCLLSAKAVSEALGITLPTVSKLLKRLQEAGFLSSERGVAGGYRLVKEPKTILLVDLLAVLEEQSLAVTECSSSHETCDQAHRCCVRAHWQWINEAIYRALSQVTLANLLHPVPEQTLLLRDMTLISTKNEKRTAL